MARRYDHHNLGTDSSDDDTFLNYKNASIDSKRASKTKVSTVKYKGFVISNTRIKPTKTSPKKYKKSSRGTFIKCHECGMWCKGSTGIKIHTDLVHRLEGNHYSDASQSDSMLERNVQLAKQSKINRLNSSNDTFPYKKTSSVTAGSSKKRVSNVQINDFNTKPTKTPDKKLHKDISKPVMFIKCRECGMLCSGTKGIKMHTNMVHKIEYKDTSQADSVFEIPKQKPEQSKIKSEQEDSAHSNNEFINLNLNSQPGLYGEVHQLNNVVTFGNQPNVQLLSLPGNQNVKILKFIPKDAVQSDSVLVKKEQENDANSILLPQPEMFDKVSLNNTLNVKNHPNEVIPKFEYHSESYKKWLRKFVNKCKKQKYPLSPVMCEDINHVLDEISCAIGNPVGFQKMKTCHYNFMKLHRILSEVIIGQMRHSLLQ